MSEKLDVKQLREMIQEAIKDVSGKSKKQKNQPVAKKANKDEKPVVEQSDAEVTDRHKKKGISSMKDFKGASSRKSPPPVPSNAKKKSGMNEGVRRLIEQMVSDALDEQISGMGMGASKPAGGGLAGSNSIRQAQQGQKQNFDWAEDLKKVKDPNVSLDVLMKLAAHQNEQIKGLAKQAITKKLFPLGMQVK
jgi:hypothetical protein